MDIDHDFDAGSIEVLSADAPDDVALALRGDSDAGFRQWFCFRALGLRGVDARLSIVDASEATYPDAFDGYRVVASYDRRRWFRVPTSYDGERLVIEHTPRTDDVMYAYFAPYPLARRERLLRRAARAPWVRHEVIGRTVLGRELSMLSFGEEGRDKLQLWVVARQHPGETMAEWLAEGLVTRLLDDDDPTVAAVLSRAVVRIVPCMNPDGASLGNHRTNAAGTDLNRAWLQPDAELSPEVLAARGRMEQTGVDAFLDVHGDERNPYCFLAGAEGNPGYGERLRALEDLFETSLCRQSPDFQAEYGYPRDEPGGGDLRTANNYVGEMFDCLSFTVEMPFKDSATMPDEVNGWSPERSMHLGQATLDALEECLDALRE
ncbi:MAG: hypothetical protein IT374_23435 [Polyangiaceae bacterium]|nr:hypothetical protein [Polyangiaceae bacterium]